MIKIESKIETVEMMLEEGFDLFLIAKVTKFPLTKIKALQKKNMTSLVGKINIANLNASAVGLRAK